MIAHNDIGKAAAIAVDIQNVLYEYNWNSTKLNHVYNKISDHGGSAEPSKTQFCWNGLRIRVGIAYGTCDVQKDPVTGGYDYYGNTVNTAARTEAAAHGGQILLTHDAYLALVGKLQDKANSQKKEQAVVSSEEAPALSESALSDVGVQSVESQGRVSLRGLKEPVELLEIKPLGELSKRDFTPLQGALEDAESGLADRQNASIKQSPGMDSIEEEEKEQDEKPTAVFSDADSTSSVIPMKLLMKKCMKEAGFRRYDDELMNSALSTLSSMKAVFALYSDDERDRVLDDLLKKWHLRVPALDDAELVEVGRDTPRLLVLAIRAATVVYTDNHPSRFVNFGSSHFALGTSIVSK